MAKSSISSSSIARHRVKKKTSQGNSVRSRATNKGAKRSFKKYSGQGK